MPQFVGKVKTNEAGPKDEAQAKTKEEHHLLSLPWQFIHLPDNASANHNEEADKEEGQHLASRLCFRTSSRCSKRALSCFRRAISLKIAFVLNQGGMIQNRASSRSQPQMARFRAWMAMEVSALLKTASPLYQELVLRHRGQERLRIPFGV